MCCTIGSGEEAELSGTKIYAGEAIYNGKYVHTLAYQNEADSVAPNAMVIPFPTNQPMTRDNIIDTSGFKDFLKDIGSATKSVMKSMSRSLGVASFNLSAEVFDHGSYTVILASHVAQIPEALKRVTESKRPAIQTQFLLRYGAMYPKQPIAICCWKGSIKPEPLLWWYEPTDKGTLFIPTMDAHNGYAPDLEAMVKTDHVISVGSTIDGVGSSVRYTDKLSEAAQQLLPKKVFGHKPPSLIKNGDMFVDINQMKSVGTLNQYAVIKRGATLNNIHYQNDMYGWS